jgi:hypothetical protein
MTVLAFAAGIGVQPAARRVAARRPHAGIIAGLGAAAAGAAVSVAAVAGPSQVLAGVGAVLLGLAYGLCLVCGLHDAEQLAGPRDRGTVLAAYYVLAYLGFAAPYGVDGLNAALGKPGTFAVLAGVAAVLAGLTWARAARSAPLQANAGTERKRLTHGGPVNPPADERANVYRVLGQNAPGSRWFVPPKLGIRPHGKRALPILPR